MSLTGEKLEETLDDKSSDSEETFETEEDGDTDESFSRSITKLKNICFEKTRKYFNSRRSHRKNRGGRLNVSLLHSKHGHACRHGAKSRSGKYLKRKIAKSQKCSVNNQDCPEKTMEVPQRGKRCRLGGKAKAKPPEEERCDKYDSDEDADSFYFSRISLGCFQKYRDDSGASTSYQRDESYRCPKVLLPRTEDLAGKTSEELELLELQQWGMSSIIRCTNRTDFNKAEDIRPDTF